MGMACVVSTYIHLPTHHIGIILYGLWYTYVYLPSIYQYRDDDNNIYYVVCWVYNDV